MPPDGITKNYNGLYMYTYTLYFSLAECFVFSFGFSRNLRFVSLTLVVEGAGTYFSNFQVCAQISTRVPLNYSFFSSDPYSDGIRTLLKPIATRKCPSPIASHTPLVRSAPDIMKLAD